ncbi:MAG: hypothetical protein V4462_04865 [Pseudomonadota bacterium]
MFAKSVEIERRMQSDRYTASMKVSHVIMDVTDQGRHRPVKAARLVADWGIAYEQQDVHVVWSNDSLTTSVAKQVAPHQPPFLSDCYATLARI